MWLAQDATDYGPDRGGAGNREHPIIAATPPSLGNSQSLASDSMAKPVATHCTEGSPHHPNLEDVAALTRGQCDKRASARQQH